MGEMDKHVLLRTASAACCLLFAAGQLAAAPASSRNLPKLRQAQASITHVIIIMQENRSFDDYFGTYPGAEGIPFPVCVPLDPVNPSAGCIKPFHNHLDITAGGPHTSSNAVADLRNGVTRAVNAPLNIVRSLRPSSFQCFTGTISSAPSSTAPLKTSTAFPVMKT